MWCHLVIKAPILPITLLPIFGTLTECPCRQALTILLTPDQMAVPGGLQACLDRNHSLNVLLDSSSSWSKQLVFILGTVRPYSKGFRCGEWLMPAGDVV